MFIFILLMGILLRIRVGLFYRFGVIFLALSAALFAYCFDPSTGLDLYRLQKYVQAVNFSGPDFWSSIWGAEESLAGTSMSGLVSFNLLCYVVRLLGDIRWLSAISVFTTIGILLSVLTDYVIANKYSSKEFGIGAILIFLGLQLQYVFSGVRNGMAVAAVVLGAYLLFYKKRGVALPIVLFFIGATMHPAVLILSVPVLLCRLKNQKAIRLLGVLAIPLIFMLPNVLTRIPLTFFQYLSNRIAFYQNTEFQYDRPEMIANLLVFATVGICAWIQRRHGLMTISRGLEGWYMNAYYILGFIMIGCSIHRDFALRIGYLMGIMAIPIVCKIFRSDSCRLKKMGYPSMALIVVIAVCAAKVYYDTALGFSHWTFL